MSKIEFVAQSGYAFTAALYDPYDDYSSLASGLVVTNVGNGIYRRDTGAVSGIVYMVATAGALKVVGYANLDQPGLNGHSEVFDTLAEAEGGSDVDESAIASDVFSLLAGARSTFLSGPTSAGGPIDQIKTVDLEYTIPIVAPADAELLWFMRCHPMAPNAYLIASKTVGLVELMSNLSPTANLASVTRTDSNVLVNIKAEALAQLPIGSVACELRQRSAGSEISRHEVDITLRHSAGRN